MDGQIFFSYSRKDSEFVDRLSTDLESGESMSGLIVGIFMPEK